MNIRRAFLAALTMLGVGVAATPVAHAGLPYAQVGRIGAEGELTVPLGVAVDPASGDVYVGNLVSAGVKEFGPVGGDRATFDSGFLSGVAVDPVNRNVYVVNAAAQAIETYTSAGAFVSKFSVAGSANLLEGFTAVQIATDASGDVYLPNAPNNEVQEFDPEGDLLATFTGAGSEALKAPTGVAVDAHGDVYVADGGNSRVEEFTPAGAFAMALGTGVDQTTGASVCTAASGDTCGAGGDGTQAVALDPAGDILAGDNSGGGFHVVMYGPAGEELADFGLGAIGSSEFGTIDTLAVNARGLVYVADGGNNAVWIYAQQSKPAVQSVSALAVGQTTATLKTTIDAGNADTAYRFEYGPSTAYGASVPVPDEDLGSGLTGPITTGQELSGLQPGATYHYRVIATNALGQTTSADETFTTPPALPPIVSTGRPRDVSQGSATLTGTLDTQGFQTSYEFDFGTDTGYGSRIFGNAGAEPGAGAIAVTLQGLTPGATYHYRALATNTFGTVYGADQTFTTPTYPSATLTQPQAPPLLPTQLLTPTGTATGGGATVTAVKASAHTARHTKPHRKHKLRSHTHTASSAHGNQRGRGR